MESYREYTQNSAPLCALTLCPLRLGVGAQPEQCAMNCEQIVARQISIKRSVHTKIIGDAMC
jgi:hypothetical protein